MSKTLKSSLKIEILIFLILLMSTSVYSQTQPWVGNNAIWKYRFEDQNLGGQIGLFKVYKTENILIGTQLCDELVTIRYSYEFSSGWQITDSVIIDTNYTYLSSTGDSVMYEQDGVFRVLYDFSAEVGDSLLIHVSNEQVPSICDDSSYSFITSNSFVDILGTIYRAQTVGKSSSWNDFYTLGSYPIGFEDGINERFGPVQFDVDGYLFPTHESNCYSESLLFTFLCFSDENLTYDVDCDYFETLGQVEITESEITVYPNPFYSILTIESAGMKNDYFISDLNGKLVKTIKSNELPFVNLSDIDNGIYWLNYFDSSGKKKSIKNH